jgi:hypothetical protein
LYSVIIAVWPVYNWWTIPMIFAMFMGYLMSASFLPSGHLGSVLFMAVFLVACLSSWLIEHEGYLHTAHDQF